jgi:glycosyltransferase involved in cell wall biosynthesis
VMTGSGEQRMRVLHLIDHLGTGGAQRDVINLCRYTDRARFELQVWALHGAQATMAEQVQLAGVAISYLGTSRRDASILPTLVRRLRGQRFDLLHTHTVVSALLGTLGNRLACRLPLIITVDASRSTLPLWCFWLCYVLSIQWADMALEPVPSGVDELESLGVPGRKIRVIPQGNEFARRADQWRSHHHPVETNRFRARWGLKPDDLVVLSVARLHPERKVGLFLRAFAAVTGDVPNAHLIFVGDGPLEGYLHELASELGVSDKVIFAGFQADPLLFYLASDLFLTISIHDLCGIASLEAMACGVPVLAFDLGAQSGETSFTVGDGPLVFASAGNARGFTEGLGRLLVDREQRLGIGRRGESRAREWITPEDRAKQHESLYRELVGRRKVR